jgi:hypothetical protein
VHRRLPLRTATVVLLGAFALVGCEADDEPISPDPDGLEEPADDPEGVDAPLEEEAEPGDGEPAIEGEGEGRLVPDEGEGDED